MERTPEMRWSSSHTYFPPGKTNGNLKNHPRNSSEPSTPPQLWLQKCQFSPPESPWMMKTEDVRFSFSYIWGEETVTAPFFTGEFFAVSFREASGVVGPVSVGCRGWACTARGSSPPMELGSRRSWAFWNASLQPSCCGGTELGLGEVVCRLELCVLYVYFLLLEVLYAKFGW